MGNFRPCGFEYAGSKSGSTPALSDWMPVLGTATYGLNARGSSYNQAICAGTLVVYDPANAAWDRANDGTSGRSLDLVYATLGRLRVCAEVSDQYGKPFNNGYLPAATAGRIRTWELEDALFRIAEDSSGGGGTGGIIASGQASATVTFGTIDNYSLGQAERLTPRSNDQIKSNSTYTSSSPTAFALQLVKKDPDPRCPTTPVWIVMIGPDWYNA